MRRHPEGEAFAGMEKIDLLSYTGKWNIPEKVRFIHHAAEWMEEEVEQGYNWEFGN